MAVVFEAVDQRLRHRVALKLIAPAFAADEEYRQRFIQEARAAAAVDDPHINPVYDAGEVDGVLCIAMCFMPGGDVRDLLAREGPLPPARAAAIIASVASAWIRLTPQALCTGMSNRDTYSWTPGQAIPIMSTCHISG